MIFRQRAAKAPLSTFVEFFWFYEDLSVDHSVEKLLPNGTVELIIDLSERPKRLYDSSNLEDYRECRQAWISGLQRQFIVIEAQRGSSMIGAHFKIGGAAPFFRFPMSELTDDVVELDLLSKSWIDVLRDSLLQAPTVDAKFDLIENFLLSTAGDRLNDDPALNIALKGLRSFPALPLREIASAVGLSQRQLLSKFDCRVGCTPKVTSRILRFQEALKAINSSGFESPADLAAQLGYYDQSHMIHEFQEFAGVTPGQYFRARTPHQDYLTIR